MTIFDGLTPPYSTIVADPPWHYDERVTEYGKPSVSMPYSTMSNDEIARLPVLDLAAADAHLFLWTTNQHIWAARDVALGWGFLPSQVLVWAKPPQGLGPGGKFANSAEFIIYARRIEGGGVRLRPKAGRLISAARDAAGISRAELHRLVRGGRPTGIVARWEDDDSLPNAADWDRLVDVLPGLSGAARPLPPPSSRERIDTTWWAWPRADHSTKPPAFMDIVERVAPGPYLELFARAPRLGWDSWGHGYETERAS